MTDDLVKRLREGDEFERFMLAERAADRIEELEAKLDKAVAALYAISGRVPYADDPYDIARTTLAELKKDQ